MLSCNHSLILIFDKSVAAKSAQNRYMMGFCTDFADTFQSKMSIAFRLNTYERCDFMEYSLGRKIAELRRKANLTQDALAEKMGVSAQAVSKWENDQSCPDIMLLKDLAKTFSVTVDELLSSEEETKSVVALVPEEKRKSPDEMIFKVVMQDGGDSCKVNLPLAMISALSKTGMNVFSFSGDSEMAKNLSNIDLGQVLSLAEAGVVGKLVEMRGSDGEMIDIYIE